MVRIGLQQRRTVVRVVAQRDAVVRCIQRLLVLQQPRAGLLGVPEAQLQRLAGVDGVPEGRQALLLRLPGEVQLGREAPLVEVEVDEEAALRQQRQQEACIELRT